MMLNLPGALPGPPIDWTQVIVGVLACGCCLTVFAVLYFSHQRSARAPLARQIDSMAIWALLIALLQALFAIEGAMSGNAIVITGMWTALLAIVLTTRRLVTSVHWIGMTQDRQQWEAAANELRESKNRFDLARKAAPGGWWEWRIPENELWGDSQFIGLLSKSVCLASGEPCLRWERILHPDDVTKVYHELTQHLELSNEIVIDCRVCASDGEYRWCRIRAVSIQQPEGASFVLAGSIQDIDDYRRTEAHLQQLSKYISRKHKLESLGELTGNVAHEFKNVLQAISGQLQFAERHIPVESEARSELTMATTLIEQASEISEELLCLSGRSNERPQMIHPNSIIRTLGILLRPMLSPDITLSLVPARRPVRIAAGPTALQQAMLNLCLNARDAMPRGGTLTVSTKVVRRRSQNNQSKGTGQQRFVCFSVSDTGTGVPVEIRSRIFEPFYTTKTAGNGTGLGLAIVADIARKHDGWIALNADNECGATFSLYVPVATQHRKPKEVRRILSTQGSLAYSTHLSTKGTPDGI